LQDDLAIDDMVSLISDKPLEHISQLSVPHEKEDNTFERQEDNDGESDLHSQSKTEEKQIIIDNIESDNLSQGMLLHLIFRK